MGRAARGLRAAAARGLVQGDGVYGDGPPFHWDYYNSFVIQPMLLDVLAVCGDKREAWRAMRAPVAARARRYAAIQERLVAPDGSFPPVGRSIAYRCGAFQLLAQMALRRELPDDVPPAQARAALDAVIRRTLDAPDTFDAEGWLRIGLCGHQPGIGERYISTGSLYLAATAFLPLGLPADDAFWTGRGSRLDRPPRVERAAVSDRQRAQGGLGRRCRTESGATRGVAQRLCTICALCIEDSPRPTVHGPRPDQETDAIARELQHGVPVARGAARGDLRLGQGPQTGSSDAVGIHDVHVASVGPNLFSGR